MDSKEEAVRKNRSRAGEERHTQKELSELAGEAKSAQFVTRQKRDGSDKLW
jgi:hypothetical protein